ncbi:MAG: endonuclease/exonuclease/phosphatase family protein [Deferrisomatales bacterium]
MRLRVATFNLENLDDRPGPSPDDRIAALRPQLGRLRADVLCLQEVNGQETPGQPRRPRALDRLLAGTDYAGYRRAATATTGEGQACDLRNLVVLSCLDLAAQEQVKHAYAPPPLYRKVTVRPPETAAREVTWERPLRYARLGLPGGRDLHVMNLHLKSRLPSHVEGQVADRDTWRSAAGWAGGFFLSSIRRAGQALEDRGRGHMLDHVLVSRPLVGFYRGTEIQNELLHDESTGTEKQYLEPDHAPVVAEFEVPGA